MSYRNIVIGKDPPPGGKAPSSDPVKTMPDTSSTPQQLETQIKEQGDKVRLPVMKQRLKKSCYILFLLTNEIKTIGFGLCLTSGFQKAGEASNYSFKIRSRCDLRREAVRPKMRFKVW